MKKLAQLAVFAAVALVVTGCNGGMGCGGCCPRERCCPPRNCCPPTNCCDYDGGSGYYDGGAPVHYDGGQAPVGR